MVPSNRSLGRLPREAAAEPQHKYISRGGSIHRPAGQRAPIPLPPPMWGCSEEGILLHTCTHRGQQRPGRTRLRDVMGEGGSWPSEHNGSRAARRNVPCCLRHGVNWFLQPDSPGRQPWHELSEDRSQNSRVLLGEERRGGDEVELTGVIG